MPTRFRRPPRVLAVVAVLLAFALPACAQLVTENAGTVSPELPHFRFLIRGGESRFVTEGAVVGQVHYGLLPNLDCFVSVPVSRKEFAWAGRELTENGLGDATVGSKLNLYKNDGVMTSTRFAVFGNVELPTGRWRDRVHNEEPFPRSLQLGSGTFDGTIGAAATAIHDRHRFAIDIAGRASTKRGGVRPGVEARIDAAYWFRLLPAAFEPGTAGMELRLVVDLSYVHRWRTHGESGNDSGHQIWIAPGAQFYATPSVLFEGNVALPALDTTGGAYGRARWSAFLAVKILF